MKKHLLFLLSLSLFASCSDAAFDENTSRIERYNVISEGAWYRDKFDLTGSLVEQTVISETVCGTFTFSYDTIGRTNELTYSDVWGGGYTEGFVYNEDGLLVEDSITENDADAKTNYYEYDENGFLIRDYSISGSSWSDTTYENNDLGLPVKQSYEDDSDYVYKTLMTYDDNGNLLSEGFADSLNDHTLTSYEYDESGNLIFKTHEKSDGRVFTNTYTYDEEGILTESTESDAAGYFLTISYTYKDGLLKETKTEDNYLLEIETLSYDEDGNLVKRLYKSQTPDGSVFSQTTSYSYNKKGLLTEVIENLAGSGSQETLYFYNRFGDLTRKDYTAPSMESKLITTYTYESGILSSSKTLQAMAETNLSSEHYQPGSGGVYGAQ